MGEFKIILRHSVIYGIANILPRMIGVVMIPIYTNLLKTDQYGTIEILENCRTVASIIVGMGLAAGFMRFYSEDKREQAQETVISTAILFTTFFALLVTIVGVCFSADLSLLVLGNKGYAEPFTVIMFVMLFSSMIELPLVVVRAREKSTSFLVICVGQFFLAFLLNVLFVVILRLGVGGWLLSSLWTSVITCTYLVVSTLYSVQKIRFSIALLKRMFAYSLPLIPASLAMFWIHNGDRFILRASHGLDEVGIYSLGYRFAMMVPLLVGQPFFLIWSVRMYDLFEKPGGEKVYARYFTYFISAVLLIWVGMSVTIKDVIHYVSEAKYHAAYKIVPLVAMGYALREFSDFFKGVLLITRRTSLIGWSTLLAAVVSTVLYFVLIPRYGNWGAALATFFTFFTMALFMFIASRRIRKVPFEFRRVGVMLGLSLVIVGVLTNIDLGHPLVNLLVKGSLSLCFFPLLYFLGFFPPRREGHDRSRRDGGLDLPPAEAARLIRHRSEFRSDDRGDPVPVAINDRGAASAPTDRRAVDFP